MCKLAHAIPPRLPPKPPKCATTVRPSPHDYQHPAKRTVVSSSPSASPSPPRQRQPPHPPPKRPTSTSSPSPTTTPASTLKNAPTPRPLPRPPPDAQCTFRHLPCLLLNQPQHNPSRSPRSPPSHQSHDSHQSYSPSRPRRLAFSLFSSAPLCVQNLFPPSPPCPLRVLRGELFLHPVRPPPPTPTDSAEASCAGTA